MLKIGKFVFGSFLALSSATVLAQTPAQTIEDEMNMASEVSRQIEADFGEIPEGNLSLEVTSWEFRPGESLTSVLEKWCGLAGCTLVKKTTLDMDMSGSFSFKGSSVEAFDKLFSVLDENGSNFRGRLYANNVLVLDHVLKNESVVVE